jgi:hypothetical protein
MGFELPIACIDASATWAPCSSTTVTRTDCFRGWARWPVDWHATPA